ncbi:unnamed protein product [Calypogeia fissa]
MEMTKILRSVTSSSLRYSRSMDVNAARVDRRRGYGKLGPDGEYETATSSFVFRVPRKLRILKLGSRRTSAVNTSKLQLISSAKPVEELSKTFLGRVRLAYEKMMLRAASKSGEISVIPVAKASRAPPALSSVVSSYPVWSAYSSRVGSKVSDLDPGFKLTAAEKKYLEHLKRSASSGMYR